MFRNLVTKSRALRVAAAGAGMAVVAAVVPVAALATTETETKLGEVTTQVSSEGVSIVLAILAGLVALIAAIIIIPKGIGMIKRFI